MKEDIIFDRWLRCAAAYRNRNCPQGLLQNRLNTPDEIAAKIFQSPADDISGKAKEVGSVRARLDNDKVRLAHDDQCAMRLNRSCELDLFPLTIGEVCLSKGWRR